MTLLRERWNVLEVVFTVSVLGLYDYDTIPAHDVAYDV